MSHRTLTSAACALLLTAGAGSPAALAQQPVKSAPELIASTATETSGPDRPNPNAPQEIHVISARAGGINLVQGTVSIRRKAETDWPPAVSSKRLKTGDRLRTEADGRAEILLNPGSFLRLDHNAEIELTNPTLDALVITLNRGTTVFEVTGTNDTKLYITVITPRGQMLLTKSGLYRIGVRPDGATEAIVRKGEIRTGTAQTVKDGRVVVLDGTNVTVAGIDKKAPEDGFETWSRSRAQDLAFANQRLRRQTAQIRGSVGRYRSGGAYGFGYAPYFGLWIFDASLGGYGFYPFYSGWGSGYYGYRYNHCYGLPWRDFTPTVLPPPTLPAGTVAGVRNSGGSSSGSVAPPTDGNFQTRPKFPGTGPTLPNDGPLTPLPPRRFPAEREVTAIRGGYNTGGGGQNGGSSNGGGVFGGRNSDASSSGGDIFRGSNTGGYNRGADAPAKPSAPAPSAAPAGPAPTTIPK